MFKKILLAYDGSEGSTHALEIAVDLAAHDGHEICLLSVIENLPRYAEETINDVDEMLEQARQHFEHLQEVASAIAARRGVTVTRHVEPGHVVETVVRLAEREKVDLIVIGGLGHSRMFRRTTGGTGSQITYHAHCSVLVVR
ncbi:MAG: universal stress protein [Planctomycetota bacterium]